MTNRHFISQVLVILFSNALLIYSLMLAIYMLHVFIQLPVFQADNDIIQAFEMIQFFESHPIIYVILYIELSFISIFMLYIKQINKFRGRRFSK